VSPVGPTGTPGAGLDEDPVPDPFAHLLERVRAVPAHDHFPGVDELQQDFADLAERAPDLVRSRRIGTSRLGEPIPVYTVDPGAAAVRDHLVVGGVHPNEPIGAWTALHLVEALVADAGLRDGLAARWHVVPCVDPDGARLNETWFPDPTSRTHYARWFYRPAPDEQVEWSFPTDYRDAWFDRPLPETQALARLIDAVRPSLYVSLHNSEFGGVYYYLSREVPALVPALHAVPAALGLPLDTGEAEAPFLARFAPAVFGTGTVAETYDYLDGLGLDAAAMVGGSSSSEYAARYGTLSLVAELPFWSDPAADDPTPTAEEYADLVRRTADDLATTHQVLARVLGEAGPRLGLDTPFLRASRAFVPILGETAAMDRARAAQEPARPATVAERFGREDLVRCFRLRYGGMLLRALDVECAAGTAPPEVRRLRAELAEVYAGWQAEAETGTPDARPIPVATLVGVQLGAVLAAAELLATGAGGPAAPGRSSEELRTGDRGADARTGG
jgi:hypothetical protein